MKKKLIFKFNQGARERFEGKYRRCLRIDRTIYTLKWSFGFFDLLYHLMDYFIYIDIYIYIFI